MSHNAPSPSEREELLRSAALGQLHDDDPRLAALAPDEPLRAELRALVRTHAATARVLREGRRIVNEARAQTSASDENWVREQLETLARGGTRARTGSRRGALLKLAGLVAVSAAALLLFLLWRGASATGAQDEVWLGEGLELRFVPDAEGGGKLLWDIALRPGEHLELSFYAEVDGTLGARAREPFRVEAHGWSLSAPEARVLPNPWRAKLEHFDALGEAEVLGWARHSSP